MSSINVQDNQFIEVLQITITDAQPKRRGGDYRVIIKHAHGTEETIRSSASGAEVVIGCKTFVQLNTKSTIHIRRANQFDHDNDPSGSLEMTGEEEEEKENHPVKLNGKPGMTVTLKLGEKMTMTQVATIRVKDANEVLEKKSESAENLDRLTAHAKILVDALDVASTFDPFPFAEGVVKIAKTALEQIDRIPSEYKALKDVALECMSHIEFDGDARRVFTSDRVRNQLNTVMALILQALDFIFDYHSQSRFSRFLFTPSDSTVNSLKSLALKLEKQKAQIRDAFVVELRESQHELHGGQHELREGQAELGQMIAAGQHEIMDQMHRLKRSESEQDIPSVSQEKEGWVFMDDPTETDPLKRFLGKTGGFTTGKAPCLPDTRVSILDKLSSWAQDDSPGASRLFWMYGVAGCGKSAVAMSISDKLIKARRLAGSFFCRRDEVGRRNPVQLLGHLASCLAEESQGFKDALLESLDGYRRLGNKHKSMFFEYILEQPLSKTVDHVPPHPVVFLIDALDECNDNGTVAGFLSEVIAIAPWIKFIVTSREQRDIKNVFVRSSMTSYDLFTDSESRHDVQEYLRMRLDTSPKLLRDKLSEKSGGLFIWLHTVAEAILSSTTGREKMIQAFLDQPLFGDAEERMAATYLTVLEQASGTSEADQEIVRTVVGLLLITSSNAPLTISSFYAFLTPALVQKASIHEFGDLVMALKPVLKLTPVEDSSASEVHQYRYLVQAHHASFLDFCAKQGIPYKNDGGYQLTRPNTFWTNPTTLHRDMAMSCFEIMKRGKRSCETNETSLGLRFNICNLDTSHKLNSEIEDLQERIATRISQHLLYSSLYWVNHVGKSSVGKSSATDTTNLEGMISDFLQSTCSLFWLEVLSLTGNLSAGMAALVDIVKCTESSIAYEMCRFVEQCFPAISSSTPHLYLSLTWLPAKSPLCTIWKVDSEFSRASILKTSIRQPSELLSSTAFPVRVDTFAVSPDERHIVSGSKDGYVRLWNLRSAHEALRESRASLDAAPIDAVAYTPDGSHILCVCNGFVYALDAETLHPTAEGKAISHDDIRCMSVSGDHVAFGKEDGRVVVLDAKTYLEVPFKQPDAQTGTHAVDAIAYSPDGTRLVYAADYVFVFVWDKASGSYKDIHIPLNWSGGMTAAAFSPDGKKIATGGRYSAVLLFDAESGEEIGWFNVKGRPIIQFLAVSYGTRIICATATKNAYVDRSDAEEHPPSSEASRHYVEDDYHYWAEETNLQLWDVDFSRRQETQSAAYTSGVTSVAFSPNGNQFVSGSNNGSVCVWDAETGQPEKLTEMRHSDSVEFVIYSPDGKYVASGGHDSDIRIWDAETGESLKILEGHSNYVTCGAYSSDGMSFVSGSSDGSLRVWDLEQKSSSRQHHRILHSLNKFIPSRQVSVLSGHEGSLLSVTFSPDGSCIASSSEDSTIRLWDTNSRKPLGDPLSGHDGGVCSIAFSKEGRRLVSGGHDSTVRIWDVNTRSAVGEPLRGHPFGITSVTFSPDGNLIFSASWDGIIRCWDAVNGKSVGHPLQEDPDVGIHSLAISPDGQYIVSGSDNGCIRIWDPQAFMWEVEESFISCGHRGSDRIPDHIPDDGWIQTSEGGLLLWVPVEHRTAVCRLDMVSLSDDERKIHIRFFWDKLCHGENWMDVRKGE